MTPHQLQVLPLQLQCCHISFKHCHIIFNAATSALVAHHGCMGMCDKNHFMFAMLYSSNPDDSRLVHLIKMKKTGGLTWAGFVPARRC
jgi:hypothetical protein